MAARPAQANKSGSCRGPSSLLLTRSRVSNESRGFSSLALLLIGALAALAFAPRAVSATANKLPLMPNLRPSDLLPHNRTPAELGNMFGIDCLLCQKLQGLTNAGATLQDVLSACDTFEANSAEFCRSNAAKIFPTLSTGSCQSLCFSIAAPSSPASSSPLVRRALCSAHNQCAANQFCGNMSAVSTSVQTSTGCLACGFCITLSSSVSINGDCPCLGGVSGTAPPTIFSLTPFTINYTAANAGATVTISLFYVGAVSSYGALATNTPNTGTFSGSFIAGIPVGQAFFVITSSTNSSILGRTNTFNILAGSVTVLQPNASSTFMSGTVMPIRFTSVGFIGFPVQFSLLQTSSMSVLLTSATVTVTSNDMTTEWLIPAAVPTGQYWFIVCPIGIYSPIYTTAPPFRTTYGDVGFTITQTTCSAHTTCRADEYCAQRTSLGICTPCSLCMSFRNAIDGLCPAKCGANTVPFGTAVPPLPESQVSGPVTLASCGIATNLTWNNNTNITFAPATANNNPNLMTARLASLLNTLASTVLTRMTGFRLNVLTAAQTRILSYANLTLAAEGRAATITLTPTPTSAQLALLGGYAVYLGFDFVAYQDPSFIYVSVSASRCLADLDLIFLLDVSGSIQLPFYGGTVGTFSSQILPFVAAVVNNYNIGPNATRVAIATFASTAQISFLFDQFTTKASLLNAIANVAYIGGGTRTSTGLNLVRTQILPLARPASAGFNRVIITVTDGNANFGFEGASEALMIQNLGVNMFAVGIGMAIDYAQLVTLATPPFASRVFMIQSYNSIGGLVDRMSAFSCSAPVPVTPGVQTTTDVDNCEAKYFQPLCASLASFVIQLSTLSGSTSIFVSRSAAQPSQAVFDFNDQSNNSLKTITVDRSGNTSLFIAVQGTGGNSTATNVFTLRISADVFNGLRSVSATVREDASTGTTVYSMAPLITDLGFTVSFNYSILNGSSGLFSIHSSTGAITTRGSLQGLAGRTYGLFISANSPTVTCLSGVLLLNVTVLTSNFLPPAFVSLTAASIRQDAAVGTVAIVAQAITSQPNAVIRYSMGVSAVCTSQYYVITGSFPYFGANRSRGNCMFWASPTGSVSDYSCTWHGCFGPAIVISSTTVLCPAPDWTLLPAGTSSNPIRITLRTFADTTVSISNNQCFSSQGQSPAQWTSNSFTSITLSQFCPSSSLPTAAANPATLPSIECSTSTRPTISSSSCVTNLPAGCPPPFFVNATTGAVSLSSPLTSLPSGPIPIIVTATQSLAADPTRLLFAQQGIAITVVPVPCPAGSFSDTGFLPCSPCAAGSFAPTTGATTCQPCGCSGNTYRSGVCNTTSNVQCIACPLNSVAAADFSTCNCLQNHFRAANGSCFPCSTCTDGQYLLSACTPLSNTVCPSTRICQAGVEFETVAPTATSNRECRTCTTNCPAGTQPNPAFPCGPFSDRQCMACPANTFKLTTTLEACTPCTTSCSPWQFISGQCTAQSTPVCTNCTSSCPSEQYLTGTCGGTSNPTCTSCTTCTAGEEYETSPCTANSNRVCAQCTKTCPASQYLSGTCAGQSTPTCLFCTTAASCGPSQYLAGVCLGSVNTFCNNCSSACKTCVNSPSQCTSCNPGNFLRGLSCVTSCGTSMYGDSNTGLCASCALSCQNCNGPLASNCTSCPIGSFLSQGQCVSTCPAGTYGITSPRQCVPCSSCADGTFRTGGCSGTVNTQCQAWTPCNSTTSFQTSAPTNTTDRGCASCRTTCPAGSQLVNTCNGVVDNSCSSCVTGTFQASTSSLPCTGCTSSCSPGQYLTGTCTATSDRVCTACTAPGTCSRDFFLQGNCTLSSNPTCQSCAQCGTGQYEIQTCTATSNRVCANCTQSCGTGQFLSGSCTATSNPTCQTCATCGSNQFVATACTATSNTVCATCQSQCSSCSNAASCNSCTPPLVLQGANCVSNCSLGLYANNSVCQSCSTGCAKCTGPNFSDCVKCNGAEFLLANGTCAATCPAGTYGDAASGRCLACGSCNLATQYQTGACGGTQNVQCALLTVCNSSSYQSVAPTLLTNRQCAACTTTCPVGQQLQGPCGGTSNPSCSTCPAGSYKPDVSGNACTNCTTTCPSGFYLTGTCTSSTSPVCLPCTSSCPAPFYLNGECTLTSNRQCSACDSCLAQQYETAPCTATSNRQCANCTTSCSSGSYLVGTCQGTTNPVCTPCTQASSCSVTQYLGSQCSQTTNTQCLSCQECTSTQYQVRACSSTENRQCLTCPTAATCLPGQFLSGTCPGSVTATFPLTVVVNGKSFAVLDQTFASSTATGCQSGLLTIPTGWAIASDDADSLAAIAGNAWGTSCAAVASGRAYTTLSGPGTPCAACNGTNCINVAGSTAGVTACDLRILVSYTPPSCQACRSSCPADQFLTGTCGGTLNRFCQQCTPCAAGTYQASPCTATSDRVCLPCTQASDCGSGTFLSGTCSATSNPVCTNCTSLCPAGSYLTGSCGGTSDRTCASCTSCTDTQYQVSACQATSAFDNTVCATCTTTCSANQYLQNTCSLFTNPTCVNCLLASQCNLGTYLSGPCLLNRPTTCEPCHSSCQSCSGPSSNQCLSCTAPLTLLIESGQQGTCSSQCPPGLFKDPFLNRCVGCDSACATCNNYGSSSCLSCPASAPYLTATSTCVSNCPAGTWNDNSTGFPRCTSCATCASNTFISGACGGASNTVCSPVRVCQPGSFVSASNTATSDRVCSPCPANQYQPAAGATSCINVDPCTLGLTFETQAATNVSNRVCSPVTPCPAATQYLLTAATLTANNVCANLTVCQPTEFQSTAPTANSNRVCSPITPCQSYQYIQTAATLTTNNVCANLTICSPGQEVTVPATLNSDRSCGVCPAGTSDVDSSPMTPCVSCSAGSYVPPGSVGPCANFACAAGTVDADQSPATTCTPCASGFFAPTAGLVSCTAVSLCPAGSFASTLPTLSSNVQCSPCPVNTFKAAAGNAQSCTGASSCGDHQYIQFSSTAITDTVCANITLCGSNQYIAVPATATSDAFCQDFFSCPVLNWISFPGNATTNRQCSSCRTCAPETSFVSTPCGVSNNAVCSNLRVCNTNTEYQTVAPTASSDRVCANLTSCAPQTEYQTAAPTSTSDRTCASLRVCSPTAEYQTAAPTATSNRQCALLNVCGSNQFQSVAPTATSNRQCQNVKTCTLPTFYQTVAPTNVSDAECNSTRVCDPITEYELTAPTYTTDRVCLPQPLPVQSPVISFSVAGSAYAVSQPTRSPSGFSLGQWGLSPSGSYTASVGSLSNSVTFTTPALSAVSGQCAIARSLEVYVESPSVAVRFQLFDAQFGASPAPTTVTFTLVASDLTVGPSGSCLSSNGACAGSLVVPTAWFGTKPTASVRFTVNGGAAQTCPGTLSLQVSVANPTVARTVALVLPQTTLFRGQTFSTPIIVRSPQTISGFNLQVTFSSGVAFTSASADVSIWSVIVTPLSSTSYLFTGQLQDPTYDPGRDQQLLSITFSLLTSGTSSTESFQINVIDLVNVRGQTVRPAGLTLPTLGNVVSRTGVSTSGSIVVGSATQRTGLIATPSVSQILNTAVIAGGANSLTITTSAVQANGVVVGGLTGLACSATVPSAVTFNAACDTLTLTTSGTPFSGVLGVTITLGTLSTSFQIQVWAPFQYQLSLADPTLSLFTLSRALSCPPAYQSSAVFVGVSFKAGALTSPILDFTSTFASLVTVTDPSVVYLATSPSLSVAGVAPGTTTLNFLSAAGATLSTASVTVNDAIVFPTRLDATVVTGLQVNQTAVESSATLYVGSASAVTGPLTADMQLATVAVSAVLSDGVRMVLTFADGIALTTTNASAVTTTSQQQVQARGSTAGTLVDVNWASSCTASIISVLRTTVTVQVTLPALNNIQLTLGARVTASSSPAALAPASVPTLLPIVVTAFYADSTSRDITLDPRTVLSFTAGGNRAALGGSLLAPAVVGGVTAGSATLQASFLGRTSSSTFQVITVSDLSVAPRSFPGLSSAQTTQVNLVSSSPAIYESVAVVSTLVLSDGTQVDVSAATNVGLTGFATITTSSSGLSVITPNQAGAVTASVSFGTATKTLALTATTTVATITSLSTLTVPAISGVIGTTAQASLTVTLSDGVTLTGPAPLSGLISYSSSNALALTVSATGLATLLGNTPAPVTLTATAGALSTSTAVPCNLQPAVGDIDLGSLTGVQFPSPSVGSTFVVPVRVNVGSFNLGFVRFVVTFSNTLSLTSVLPPTSWNGSVFGVSGADVSIGPATAMSGTIEIARLVFAVSSGAGTTAAIGGRIVVLQATDGTNIGGATPRNFVAGSGTVLIAGGVRRRSSGTPCANAPCAVCSSPRQTGDANGDCVFDGSDVTYSLQVLATLVSNPGFLSTLLPAQQAALDMDGNGVVDLLDSALLNKASYELVPFARNIAFNAGARSSCLLSVDADLLFKGDVAATASNAALFVLVEGPTSVLTASTLVQGTVAYSNAGFTGVIYSATATGAGHFTASLALNSAASFAITLVVVGAGSSDDASRTVLLAGSSSTSSTLALSAVTAVLTSAGSVSANVSLGARNALTTAVVTQSALACHTISCSPTGYITQPATSLVDTQCAPYTLCLANQYESVAPTATSNRQCSAVTNCTSSQYQTAAPTATSNRACAPVTTCTAGVQYESQAPTTTSNRVCLPVLTCTSSQYQTVAPTATSNRECTALTVCTVGVQYQTVAATATSNRECANALECTSLEYASPDLTATSNRVCNTLTVCTQSQQETVPPTATSNRQCTDIDYCNPNPCGPGGICSNVDGSFFCDYCNPNPCYNSATCESSFDGPVCMCTAAYCGDCCGIGANVDCPGGEQQTCSRFSAQSNTKAASVPIGTIAGAVLGGFVGLILVLALAMFLLRRRGRSGEETFDKQPLAVYSMQNPGYGELSPEDTLTPNFLRCVAYGMLRGRRLAQTSDEDLKAVYQLLNLPQPSATVTTTLREHAVDFLDTVIPLQPEVICDSLIEEAVNFVAEAMPDLLIEVAIDVVAARARVSGSTDEQLYEQYYAALEEAGVEYEMVADGLASRAGLYAPILEPDAMSTGYMDTGVEDYTADYAMAGATNPGFNPTYAMAAAGGKHTDGNYAMAAGGGKRADGTYAMASGNAAEYGVVDGSPYALAAASREDEEPVYSPANDAEPTYSFAGAKDADEPTYTFAANLDGDSEPRYALGTVGGREGDEPTYSLAGALGAAESNDYDDPAEEANEPVYDMSEDAA